MRISCAAISLSRDSIRAAGYSVARLLRLKFRFQSAFIAARLTRIAHAKLDEIAFQAKAQAVKNRLLSALAYEAYARSSALGIHPLQAHNTCMKPANPSATLFINSCSVNLL